MRVLVYKRQILEFCGSLGLSVIFYHSDKIFMFTWSVIPWVQLQAITTIGRDEGIKGYWKGNLPQVFVLKLPVGAWWCRILLSSIVLMKILSYDFVIVPLQIFQVIRVIPYSAVQLFAYEIYKVCLTLHYKQALNVT